ncbi:Serine/threonine-protein kinase-like protein [Emericellopsis cladophorae]|uniref:non-specific serine/threonine protein kinase n=1 Tax=Emericellopsis cladophorae TaxID=2686198 RepID=A0A9Q0BEW1_9HYPO|nr:Serine/threonine-protein kinase-like protein [Emericellopsis cladophorae]KAI6783332.1 Serine/threonine-protein kinase-like protein [Emericellopsis cladophorae]
MSSAALQTATHQPANLSTPPLAAPPNRQYASSHSSPIVEPNNAHQSASGVASPSSRRPPSRKASGNSPNPVPEVTGRTSLQYQPQSQTERIANMPPIAPPRTSSNQQGASSRRYERTAQPASSRPSQPENSRAGSSRSDANVATDSGHRSKRAANTHFAQDLTGRQNENRDNCGSGTVLPVRTAQGSSKPPVDREENILRAASNAEDPSMRPALDDAAPPPVVGMSPQNDERRTRSRHDYSNRSHKGTAKFGDFILGNTIGEGEFGKVKLGWKQDSNAQVAIKLIKRDVVGSNPNRLAKIRREVTILRDLQHPNIVQLIDMVEADRYIGIILEYASGGELFDYILNHRYLKDQSARRLFAQLVSGVGYLHKRGIVHRDLKLENLLLDRNRNIIITDFGFANTFDPHEELSNEEELNLADREFVKKSGLDKIKPNGMRKGDLMQTSCGSPCYAAPELVVSDCLYTGRKVDVWSCGVILYAMLAGYLPFDDDPANPEGDNINLLYKYIVNTPLTFPEYVTPHARDLLRRILVPQPRKRADLFEVARHSWLSDYAHVVEFITSSTTLPDDVQKSITAPEEPEAGLTRSNSVREAHKQKAHSPTTVGGLSKAYGKIDHDADVGPRTPKESKRRTVQVEYVAPTTRTQRGGEEDSARPQPRSTSRGRQEPYQAIAQDKPLPRDPPVVRDAAVPPSARPSSSRRPQSSHRAAAPRGPREGPMRPNTDNVYIPTTSSGARPQTGNSMSSAASMGLQSMGHYGQPVPPAVADTNAEGRMAQPTHGEEGEPQSRPNTSVPPKFAKMTGMGEGQPPGGRGHKRSSTLGEIGSKLLGRNGSVFGGRGKKRSEQQPDKSRKYPPVSMQQPLPADNEPPVRPSMESRASRRSFSFGLGKKRSGSVEGSQGSSDKADRRRFSLIPPSFSFKSGSKDPGTPPSEYGSQNSLSLQNPRADPPRTFAAHGDARNGSPTLDPAYNNSNVRPHPPISNQARHQRYASAQLDGQRPTAVPSYMQSGNQYAARPGSSGQTRRPPTEPQASSQQYGQQPQNYRPDYASPDSRRTETPSSNQNSLPRQHKKFTDGYQQGHGGSSGAAKRVMDLFRRRGKARGGEER